MSNAPAYFNNVRHDAKERWNKLEQDPELAGPWKQLFEQVQSPRYVLSELLQNADDAKATEATVSIEDGVFVFEHNGIDFTEEHFRSLCSFAYSNKRTIHTIGFRGIGFKSVFSLGDVVELSTPSLSIKFHREHFTEPIWSEGTQRMTEHNTRISVEITSIDLQKEAEKNLMEWRKNPISLLFFKNIRNVRIMNKTISWEQQETGPIPESQWFTSDVVSGRVLLIRSEEEEFPPETLNEIRRVRRMDDKNTLPPCKIEIVLGVEGRIYAVLPTDIHTGLPFACNAPFILNPDRVKIKNPAMSATNRWLLKRVGRLVASSMLYWLGQKELSLAERSDAYKMLPGVYSADYQIDQTYAKIIRDTFDEEIDEQRMLLTDDGQLLHKKKSIIVPLPTLEIWSPIQASEMLDDRKRPVFCRNVRKEHQKILLERNWIVEISKNDLFDILQQRRLPKPETWNQLLMLWAYLNSEHEIYYSIMTSKNFKIVPVQGKKDLYAANELVRLGEKKILQSDADWQFIERYLVVFNANWTHYMAEQLHDISSKDSSSQKKIRDAYGMLRKIELDKTNDANKTIRQVVEKFCNERNINHADCIRLAQIAAKLRVDVRDKFPYITQDLEIRYNDEIIFFDKDSPDLEHLLPKHLRESHLLHDDYLKFNSCSRDEWNRWIMSGYAGVMTFVPLEKLETYYYSNKEIEEEAIRRGYTEKITYPYKMKNSKFSMLDWDFPDSYKDYWNELAVNDNMLWVKITKLLLAQKSERWDNSKSAKLIQNSYGNSKYLTQDYIRPSWIMWLQDLPCLPDEYGTPHKPADLLRLTSHTAPMKGIEAFIHSDLEDNVSTYPLLDLLGVQTTPIGPDSLLKRIRGLAAGRETSPTQEVEKWYRRLDQIFDSCSTEEQQNIKNAMEIKKIIRSQDGSWMTSSAIFIFGNEEIPEIAVVMKSVSNLSLWRKVGVNERPTVDLVIKWLKKLKVGAELSADEADRVRRLIVRHPARIYNECNCWLNVVSEWSSVDSLDYGITDKSDIKWKNLYPWIQKRTADLRQIQEEDLRNQPFSRITPLEHCIQNRPNNLRVIKKPGNGRWLRVLGEKLRYIKLDNTEDTESVRTLADRLANIDWHEAINLEIIPHINNIPAGQTQQVDVVWDNLKIYVEKDMSCAKLARRVPEEISQYFTRSEIKSALHYSFERSDIQIHEYLNANFELEEIISQTRKTDDISKDDLTYNDVENHSNEETQTQLDASAHIENEDETEQTHHDEDNEINILTPTKPKKHRRKIIEEFAKRNGFKQNSERLFHRHDGYIKKEEDSSFPWIHYDNNGRIIHYYFPIDKCLEREQIEIDTHIWDMILRDPNKYALILRAIDDVPKRLDGNQLKQMQKNKQILVHPATYRLEHRRLN